ncbi:MAG: hypothetical protein COA44_14095 [Arcobacter sp.]|nr:MAG: hypothetical protein COA44_14095 [Arcobacter sp.]
MKTQILNISSLQHLETAKVCEDFFYKFNRYNFDFTIVLLYSNTPLDSMFLQNHIRKSDKLVNLQNNLFCLVLDMTSQEQGLKAIENLISLYEIKHFSQKLYISFANTQDYSDAQSIKSHLFSFLNYAVKENNYNQITDGFYELEHV